MVKFAKASLEEGAMPMTFEEIFMNTKVILTIIYLVF